MTATQIPRQAIVPAAPLPGSPRSSADHIALAEQHAAHNYSPLPIVASHAEGAWITDLTGRRYLDCLAAYSAVNFGHSNPQVLAAAREQLERVTLVSRAFHHDQFGPFCAELAGLIGKEMVLPMNTGAEAVETGLKLARKWGQEVRGIPAEESVIVVASGNFHGRTTTIISFSDDPDARAGFGPYTPGFRTVPYADAAALERTLTELEGRVVAVLLEPIQGEAGVIVPPPSYLPAVRAACTKAGVLMIADEIQSGLGRTGRTLASEHWGVQPDVVLLGKALGGGVLPVSAVLADADVMEVFQPGQHGSTFGGNPLACAVGRAVVGMLGTGYWQARASALGEHLHMRLGSLVGDGVTQVRGLGLWAGIDVDPAAGTGREVCKRLLAQGVLAKDTHGQTVRLAPPLVIEEHEIDLAVDALSNALA
ncbi:ornithine--oxo-acid transaminase [Nocardioides cavernaquae]|uniref:ornithine aminotransferase n=1 Tax=Nocardioides cavernaquae TaxID=2321396 RepID=A0A3A5H6D5_9ACTN|nr:ornithine--oxo-acid transaminase [Nocardioides cavernaquae]RJS46249.1 ornithine--oxo-acid transaminase [Nocardioides cavernaquae]